MTKYDIVGRDERIECPSLRKDVTEDRVERFTTYAPAGSLLAVSRAPELPWEVTRPERSGVDRVGDVDDRLAVSASPKSATTAAALRYRTARMTIDK